MVAIFTSIGLGNFRVSHIHGMTWNTEIRTTTANTRRLCRRGGRRRATHPDDESTDDSKSVPAGSEDAEDSSKGEMTFSLVFLTYISVLPASVLKFSLRCDITTRPSMGVKGAISSTPTMRSYAGALAHANQKKFWEGRYPPELPLLLTPLF